MSRLIKHLMAVGLIALLAFSLAAPDTPTSAERPALSPTVLAQADVQSLAALMPADTAIFIALRTDDNYIALLDSLLQKALQVLPQAPSLSLTQLLDQAVQPLGGNFQSTIRSWLGDNAALAIGSPEKLLDSSSINDLEAEILLAVQITSRAEAQRLLESLLPAGAYTKNSAADFTDYSLETASGALLRLRDDLLLFGTEASVNSVLNRAAKLNADPQFQKTIAALPENGYNIIAYFSGAIVSSSPTLSPAASALGATILDGRALTLDFVVPDLTAQTFGALSSQFQFKPADAAFARFMPANTILSLQMSDLKSYYDLVLAAARASNRLQGQEQQFERSLEQIENLLRSTLRLDLNDDILSWMTGDFAIFIAYRPQERSLLELFVQPGLRLPFVGYDVGLLIETTDAAKAAKMVAELGNFLAATLRNTPEVNVTLSEKRVTIALNVPIVLSTPVEIIIGTNDSVFYVATGAAAAHIESGQEGLSATAGYREAQQYFLPESPQLWYMSTDAVNLLGEVLAFQQATRSGLFLFSRSTFNSVRSLARSLAPLLSSSSISFASKDGFQVLRAVLSLPE
ncbi:MAG: DUF3352 domain-containing protein [Chloroflexota bacterium]|nr:MAG: DUF3352 domain-containing protein [Chloroflexota bacterium]